MFCTKCGQSVDDNAAFCTNCGTPITAKQEPVAPQSVESQEPVAPQPQPVEPQPETENAPAPVTIDFSKVKVVNPYWHLILGGIAVFAAIWGLLNVFCVFHVRAAGEYMSVSDFADDLGGGAAFVYIGNILFGLLNLAAAAVGILYFLKVNNKVPYYDQYIGRMLPFRPGFMMGIAVAGGAFLQMFTYLFCRIVAWHDKLGVNWTTWVILVIFGGLALLDKFLLEEKNPAQTYTPVL